MHWKPRGWTLIGMLLLAVPGVMSVMKVTAGAQSNSSSAIATTQVTDTIYRGDGTLANGTVLVTWQGFTTALGQAVPSGTTSATITGGALSLSLVPNAGSTPMGTYYTAVYHLDDGSVSREFWVVPASQYPVIVSAIRTTVLPTSVAMQTVSKSYVDTAIAAAVTGHPLDGTSPYVMKSGDTMTGALVLPGDPTTTNQAADKHYVDVNVAAATGGLGQKVSLLPSATQAVVQPVGTQLQVNNLNGEEYASQYVTGLGKNGITNALTGPDCASGCDVDVERTYVGETYQASTWNSGAGGTHVLDNRDGQRRDTYLNPTSPMGDGLDAGQVIDVTSTRNSAAEFAAGGSGDPNSYGLVIQQQGFTGGSNLFPATIENVPYFKTNYNALNVSGVYNTMGQHSLHSQGINCYGVGDCLIGSQFLTASGGFRDEADEGAHPFDIQIQEDSAVFQGTCSTGCSAGSTVVKVAATSAGGTQGEGRYLIDKNPSLVITAGALTGGTGQVSSGPGAGATFTGTNFPVSVFLATAQVIPSQANNVAPGTVTVPIATSGVTAGFATNTSAVPTASGVACVTDQPNGTNPHNYEMATYTVVDGTHLQMTLNKVHRAGATIAFGGLCGYGLEQTVDTVGSIRQVFPVIGSYSPTGLYYGGGPTSIIGLQGNTSSFANVTLQVASIARSGNVVTVTTAGNLPVDVNGLTMNVSGVTDQSYNGSFVVTSTGPNTLTYSQSGANSTSTGGTVAKLTGGYVLYPMAEVLGVFDAATKSVDGQLTLAANTVPWGVNDPVEEPHYYQESVSGDMTFVGQTTPRATFAQTAGVEYEGNVGPGLSGWTVFNSVPATSYFGNGGTHSAPHAAYEATGIWQRTMEMQAGEESVFTVHCNSHGCGKWNSGYNVFEFDSSAGGDTVSYQPTTSTLGMSLRGTAYQFSPQAFSAQTINVGTVNATTLNGAVSAAQLPLFGASGSGHGRGAVPDPGATAGTTRYLREDGTWSVPSGSGGSSGLGIGSSFGAAPIAGASADYNFLQGTGAVLTDNSGNNNNGTLGSGTLTPVWTSNGLAFSGQEQVALPASLNGSETMCFSVYVNPLTSGVQPVNEFPLILSASNGGAGFNLLYGMPGGGAGFITDAYAPSIYANNTVESNSQNASSGFHVYCAVLGVAGSSLDRFFTDGSENTYGVQGSSAGMQTTGNFFLGSSNVSPWNISGFLGTMYRATFFPTQLSAAQIQTVSTTLRADAITRGVITSPVAKPVGTPMFHAIGDSITAGYLVSSPWENNMTLTNQPNYSIVNWGISGITGVSVSGSEPNRVGEECVSTTGPAVAAVFLGTNDFAVGTPAQTASTPQSVMNGLAGEVQTLKQAGCLVFMATMLSRSGTDAGGVAYDADKNGLDALILSRAKLIGADGVIDFAAEPLIGADGAYSNGTNFNPDGIHPMQVMQNRMGAIASNALNYYFGYSQTNPHVVTAATYMMLAGDGYITANPTANQTLTLPDCTGQSGAVYTVVNLQSAFSVGVVAGSASQLINGLAVGTSVVVPANGSLTLRDVPNPKTVSGCHWEK